MEMAVVTPTEIDDEVGTEARVVARRERFREAVARLGQRANSTELVRMLLLPGALALVGGFGFMILGWYGASHTHREIEQVPYLISGGLIGLALAGVGTVVLGIVFFTAVTQRFQEETQAALKERITALEARLEAVTGQEAVTGEREAVLVAANDRHAPARPRRRTKASA